MRQKLFLVVLIAGFMAPGCKNNTSSTSDSTSTSVDTTSIMATDTTANMKSDSGTMATIITPADTMVAMADSHMPVAKGMAKPNPAKKGMKGKVMITPAPRSSAKMEMDNAGVYSNVEVIPSYPGGYKGLQKYFDDNLEYPADATNEGVEGTVNVTFTVDENGKLSGAQTTGNKLGYGLEAEALRVVSKMPMWTPGKLKGQNVKTKYTLPVRFQLY